MNEDQARELRAPFPPEQIGKLPKGGTQLDYVGHAAVTDRLLAVDPQWKWEPDRTADGRWDVQHVGNEAVLTGTLTIAGVSRPCVGIASAKAFELFKQLQSDAIRNGAMRFGVALDLWSKEDLTADPEQAKREYEAHTVAVQKQRLVEACGGDTATAKELWAGRSEPLSDDDMAALLDEARQRT